LAESEVVRHVKQPITEKQNGQLCRGCPEGIPIPVGQPRLANSLKEIHQNKLVILTLDRGSAILRWVLLLWQFALQHLYLAFGGVYKQQGLQKRPARAAGEYE